MNDLIVATVHKNGSSWAVVIPKAICRAFDIKRGDQMVVTAGQGGSVSFRKITDAQKKKIIKW